MGTISDFGLFISYFFNMTFKNLRGEDIAPQCPLKHHKV